VVTVAPFDGLLTITVANAEEQEKSRMRSGEKYFFIDYL
jgi:hypothetical protein